MGKYFPDAIGNDHFERPCPYGDEIEVEHSMFGREDEEIEANLAEGMSLDDPFTKYYCPTCITLEQSVFGVKEELVEMGFTEEQAHKLTGSDKALPGRAIRGVLGG